MTMLDAAAGNLDSFAASIDQAAEAGLRSLMPQIYENISRVCDASGNTTNADGRPMSHELLLEMFDGLEVAFDEEGNHNLMMVVAPDVAEKIEKLPPMTEEQQKAWDEMIEHKRREFNERKRQRKLAKA